MVVIAYKKRHKPLGTGYDDFGSGNYDNFGSGNYDDFGSNCRKFLGF
jgi:hypothetical protein